MPQPPASLRGYTCSHWASFVLLVEHLYECLHKDNKNNSKSKRAQRISNGHRVRLRGCSFVAPTPNDANCSLFVSLPNQTNIYTFTLRPCNCTHTHTCMRGVYLFVGSNLCRIDFSRLMLIVLAVSATLESLKRHAATGLNCGMRYTGTRIHTHSREITQKLSIDNNRSRMESNKQA